MHSRFATQDASDFDYARLPDFAEDGHSGSPQPGSTRREGGEAPPEPAQERSIRWWPVGQRSSSHLSQRGACPRCGFLAAILKT